MVTVGSVSREEAARKFHFLAEQFSGRRTQIKEFTHRDPEFVFWVAPNGKLHDAKRSHRDNVPRGHEWILRDEPDYGGFLRGRVASLAGNQLIVVYCRAELLVESMIAIRQLLEGLRQLPIPLNADAIVISDNGDLYGNLLDLYDRGN